MTERDEEQWDMKRLHQGILSWQPDTIRTGGAVEAN